MPGSIQSIERAAAILRLLSGRSRRLGVGELAGELGLPKGTVHGILRTLQLVGFVEQDAETGKYQLGAALLHMGSSYLDGNELRTRALNWADSLAARSEESVRIGTLHEGQALVVHHVFRPDNSRQALEVGALLPGSRDRARQGAVRPPPVRERAVTEAGLEPCTSATVVDPYGSGASSTRCGCGAGPSTRRSSWRECLAGGSDQDRRGRPSAPSASPAPSTGSQSGAREGTVAYVREAARAVSRDLGAIPW